MMNLLLCAMPSSIKYGAPFVSTNLEVKKSYRKFALVRIKVNDLVPCKEKTLTSTSGLFLPHLILKSPSLSAWLLPYCCLTHSKRRRWRKERKKIRSRSLSLCIFERKSSRPNSLTGDFPRVKRERETKK